MVRMIVILNLGLKMDPVLVGMIGFIPRIFDALSDPVIGYISDIRGSRWGRRRPYIFCGAILAGSGFALMWQLPPGHSELFYFWLFLSASIFYFLIYTLFATPLIAFGFEMTPDYHERTRLLAFANTFGQLAWVGAPWFYAFMESGLFEDLAQGARVLALLVGGTICVLGVIPAIFCRERNALSPLDKRSYRDMGAPKEFSSHVTGFFKEFDNTFKCRPFVKLCSATFLVFNGFQLGTWFTLYVLIYYMCRGDKDQASTLFGLYGTFIALCTLGVISLTAWISSKIGKRRAFLLTISVSLIGYSLKWLGYNQSHPYWLFAACPFIAFGSGSLFTLMGSMVADVCDYNELETGRRREGVFGAIFWWMIKVGMAITGLLGGILLKASGFDVEFGAAQSETTLLLLRLFDILIPIISSLLAIWIIATYSITETSRS